MKYVRPGKNYAEELGIKGPVRKLMTVTRKVYVHEGKVVPDRILLDTIKSTTNCVVRLNDAGHRIWERSFEEGQTTETSYNDAGQYTRMAQFEKGILKYSSVVEYDADDRIVSTFFTSPDGSLSGKSEYVYRPDGQVAETRSYTKGSPNAARVVHNYDGQGHKTSIEAFTAEGELERTQAYTLDALGRTVAEATIYQAEHMKRYESRTENVLNDKGDIVAQTVYGADGNVKNRYTYKREYDSEGKLIIAKRPKDEAKREDVIHTDQHGNWTRMVVYHNDVPIHMHERTYVYEGMPDVELVHPLDSPDMEEGIALKDPIRDLRPMPAKLMRWVMDVPGLTADQFPVLRYYTARFDEPAVVVNFNSGRIENMAFYKAMMEKLHAVELHSYHNARSGDNHTLTRYTLELPYHKGYMVQANSITHQNSDNYSIPDHMGFLNHDHAHLGPIMLLKPRNSSSMYDQHVEHMIRDLIDECTLTKLPSKPRINVIEVRGSAYTVVEHQVSDSFTIRDLDINYGHGFSAFHSELMNRFSAQSKGLVLFHGVPGTGKTYYIRHLLRQMAASKKRVLYMPPNMVDHLTDPNFMTFLISTVKNWSHEGEFCVLLIEDAEPLLAKRQEGVRIQGVTNLLNMTDGLLNDMLNLQIICTFNVDLRRLDSALLRPGRLLARKEFKALSELDANLLAQRLGIKHHFKGPASLSEIYARLKDSSTLVHDVDPNNGASSAIDDLT
jgi:hypothetical protein